VNIDGSEILNKDMDYFNVQSSTNFIHWSTLTNIITVENGKAFFEDYPENAYKFYRIILK
jgi:hypothetical protein